MCGIIASIKEDNLFNYLINGLKKEEYRGYDSCGIGYLKSDKIYISKVIGSVAELKVSDDEIKIGLGHTRWATHGKNTLNNAHPHLSNHGLFALVHNGTIYNYQDLKNELLTLGFSFYGETDSEVIANYLEYQYGLCLDVKLALENTIAKLQGTYALCIIFCFEKRIYFAKNSSPLILGINKNEYTLISDINALQDETKYIDLDDGEYGYISLSNYAIFKQGKKIHKKESPLETKKNNIEEKKFTYYMEKEINEIPNMINLLFNNFQNMKIEPILESIRSAKKLIFVASGTSFHAGLIGKSFFQKESEVILASELYTEKYHIDKDNLYIFISQSGETMDVLKSLEYVHQTCSNSLGITNVANSSLYKKCKYQLLIYAQQEIAVASTKAYINEVVLLFYIASLLNNIDAKQEISKYINYSLTEGKEKELKGIAKNLKDKQNAIFIGKGKDYYLAKEASLKLKEVSYIHSEAMYSGELKHGSIALIEQDFPVFVIADSKPNEYILSAIEEIKARGGKVYIFTYNHKESLSFIPLMIEFFYLAFYVAKSKGNRIDKPRNLAKSVTVE